MRHVYSSETGAIFTFSSELPDFDAGEIKNVAIPGATGQVKIMFWGKNNSEPQLREELVCNNNIIPALIAKKRDILVGNGIYLYKESIVDGKKGINEVEMPSEIKDFLEKIDIEHYLMDAASELMKHQNLFVEYIRDKAGMTADGKGSIASFKVQECKYIRAEKKDKAGMINNWYWSGHWGCKKKDDTFKIEAIPNFVKDAKQAKFIIRYGDKIFNNGYYYIPSWWAGRQWINLSNQIPIFHNSNLNSGYNIRWHIEVPDKYFLDFEKYNNCTTVEERTACFSEEQKAEKDFIDTVNKFLAGPENSGRALFTKYELNTALGKDFPGIKITALNYDMKDDSLLTLFEKSNTANISAQGIHPTLAGVETQGKLSSGTEIRNAFLMYLIINTPLPRKMMLKPLEFVQKANGWDPEIKFGFRDFEMSKLADEKSGIAQRNTPSI
jgi:hypothetical protein